MSEENIDQRIIGVNIEHEMEKSYIDYAMSVIIGRALPDVRDGLKPVHRRILYSMNELGITSDKPYKKSVRIVGDVLGKYHPHGDSSVYEAMVRLAQTFSTRYLLVDGHGNFGSVDGDGAAAMRYTEARMAKITAEMLREIDKETVDFVPNFDGELEEPSVLPARIPNLLVNGSSGIAVGMATSIPPHNLNEVIDGVIAMIENPEIEIEEIIKYIKGPDFPTSAIIMGKRGIRDAYMTGRGKIMVRSRSDIEPMSGNKSRIIVTEIPYQVNKARLIEKIADLARDKKIEGIADLRDESDKDGLRIVIETKRDVNPQVILNQLYKMTQLQDSFSVIMLALVNNKPKVLNLKQVLECYLNHQREVIVRRTKFDLNKAEARKHILDGLLIALDHIDAVIKLIRSSKTEQIAKEGLVEQFALTVIQAQAILDMRFKRLTGLERQKIEDELKELLEKIKYFNEILGDPHIVDDIIKTELTEIKRKFGDERKTEIAASEEEIDLEDLIQEETMVVTMTHFGYIKRLALDTYRNQKRGGKGISGLATREEDYVTQFIVATTHTSLLFFTNRGRVYKLKVYQMPEAGRQAKGTPIINLLNMSSGEKITAVVPVGNLDELNYITMITKHGIIKRTKIEEFAHLKKSGLNAINLRENDNLIEVKMTKGNEEIIVVTENGKSIRFSEENIRSMGRAASGVKAMRLSKDDSIVAMEVIEEGKDLLTVTEKGFGKRTSVDEYRSQGRSGSGIINYKVTEKTGKVVGTKIVDETNEIIMISTDGTIIRTSVASISRTGRSTQGVTVMKLSENDSLVCIEKIIDEDNDEVDNLENIENLNNQDNVENIDNADNVNNVPEE